MRLPLVALPVLALCLLPGLAAAQEATVTPGNTLTDAPAAWLGAVPHLVVMGTLNGRVLDIQYPDMAMAADIATFSGKREYLPGEGGAYRYGDFEVALEAVIDGAEKAFEFEFENFDFSAHDLPATFALGAENFPEGAFAFLEAAAEWETATETVNDEIGAWTGTLTVELDEGTADAQGLSGDGLIGGLVVAEQGADRLVISFTVPVAEYEIDD